MYWNEEKAKKALEMLRLIETWDVLKYKKTTNQTGGNGWLIETWDVLKWQYRAIGTVEEID